MLLILHNLPHNMSLASIKKLVQDNCGAQEVLLDNLINEGPGKRVTVGLVDEMDAALLIRKINGLFLGRHRLFIEEVCQKNNSYMNPHKETVVNPLPQAPFYQQDFSFGYHQLENQNRWTEQPPVLYPDKKGSLWNSDAKRKRRRKRGSKMPENRDEHDNSMYEQTYQQNDFEINRSYSGQIEIDPTNFSDNPNNSTFTNFNPDTYIQSSTDFNAPPSKIPRFGNKFGPAATVNNDDTYANKFVKIPLKPRVHQNFNLFGRAVRTIAGDIMKKANIGFLENYRVVNQNLKKSIESRINVIMQDKVANTVEEIIQFYRTKFAYANDPQFLKTVLENTQCGMADPEHPDAEPSGKNSSNPPAVPVQQEQSNRLARSKRVLREQKKLSKMEYMIEDLYDLDPTLRKAVNEELRSLCEAYLMESSQPEVDEDEEKLRLILRKRAAYTFKKVMRIHLTKRLLNITDNLVIRVFVNPKTIKRDDLDQFLKEKGITYVKKSIAKKLYVAMAPSYEVYDDLIAMQHAMIGDCSLEFRPLYLVGPPGKKRFKKRTQRAIEEDDESVDDEELECLIEETENKVIKKTEIVKVALTSNVKQFAETVVEILNDDEDAIVPGGPQAGDVATNGNYTIDIDVVRDKTNHVVMIEDDKNVSNSKGKKEYKDEGAHGTSLDTKFATEDNDKADNVQVDDSKPKAVVNVKENIEIINKEAEKDNETTNESDVVTVADNAEVNEENLCSIDVDDDDLEDF